MGSFRSAFDDLRRRVTLVAEGELDGPGFRRAMEAWLTAALDRLGHDRLYDLRRYAGTVTNDDVRHVGRLMRAAGANLPEGLTVFVSPDAGFGFWARAMRLELPLRRLEVVKTMEAAEALLAKPR